jgi:hypothetical protein
LPRPLSGRACPAPAHASLYIGTASLDRPERPRFSVRHGDQPGTSDAIDRSHHGRVSLLHLRDRLGVEVVGARR